MNTYTSEPDTFNNENIADTRSSKRESEPIEISYLKFANVFKEDPSIMSQKIAAAINVQLTLPDGSEIPFVAFNGFSNALNEDKVYIYGPSGSGKSRTIYELIKPKVTNLNNIFIINPRNTVTDASAELGRMDLYDLVGLFSDNDAVVWNNFPDDMVKKDFDSGRKALEIISSKNIKNILIALKPKYLEAYRDIATSVLDLYQHFMKYDGENIKGIVKLYGTKTRFSELYRKYITMDLDKISNILWEKDPNPLTVLDYYNDLSNKASQMRYKEETKDKKSLDAVLEAENLLHSTEYYDQQFRYISNLEERRNDYEFLYTLRLCYEIGYNRTIPSVEELQKGIFNSVSPKEAARKLNTWVYLSGPYYSMHDAARQSIEFDSHIKVKVMNYLADNFSKVVPKEKNQIYAFSVFFGKNIQYLPRKDPKQFLPNHVYEHMKSSRYFEKCIGQGIGETFYLLNEDIKETVLGRLDVDIEFAEGFGFSLGSNFSSLDETHRQKVFERIYSGMPFASYFGESLGQIFKYLPKNVQKEVFDQIKKNVLFANGVGRGFGYSYSLMDTDLQHEILEYAKTNSELTIGLGLGLGKNFSSLGKQLQMEILHRAENNHIFDQGLGHGIGYVFEQFDKTFREKMLTRAEKGVQSDFGIGFGVGITFTYLTKEFQKEMVEKAKEDGEYAYGLGMGAGYGFGYLSKEYQNEMIWLSENSKKFAYGLGCGFGLVFNYLSRGIKDDAFARADKNIDFDRGLGFGIGISFAYLVKKLQEEMFDRAHKDAEFAYGLGYSLGYTFTYLPKDLRKTVQKQSENNPYMRRGFGCGAAYGFQYQHPEKKRDCLKKLDIDGEFAVGFGIGAGRLFKYFSPGFQTKLFEKTKKNLVLHMDLAMVLATSIHIMVRMFKKKFLKRQNAIPSLPWGWAMALEIPFLTLAEVCSRRFLKKQNAIPSLPWGWAMALGDRLSICLWRPKMK